MIYYSNTGNTKLACEYLKSKIRNIKFDLVHLFESENIDIIEYDVIGFAFFADAWQPSKIFIQYVEKMKNLEGKYAFSLNTYGCISGKSAKTMCNLLEEKNMKLLGAHSLHTPENYPPMIVAGYGYENSPNEKEKSAFDSFIEKLDEKFAKIYKGEIVEKEKVKIGLLNQLLPSNPDIFTRSKTGEYLLEVDEEKCIKCGICERVCQVHAISIAETVIINKELCQKCWSCYNHCPQKALVNGKYRGDGQYPKPLKQYANKLAVKR